MNYYFDVEFCQESIFCIHKFNGAVLKALITASTNSNICVFSRIFHFTGSIQYFIGSIQIPNLDNEFRETCIFHVKKNQVNRISR